MASTSEQNLVAPCGDPARPSRAIAENGFIPAGTSARVLLSVAVGKTWAILGLTMGLSAVAFCGCTTTDPETAGANLPPGQEVVPGEINPNGPEASQQVRTTPGVSF